nr:centromere protein U isoform X2 [Misgurnus anguillicaudatus]
MSRMTKTLKAVQQELKSTKKKSDDVVESPQGLDISSIEKASFFQGDHYSSHGNPLHSTALEEGLSPGAEQNQRSAPEKTGRQQTGKTAPGVPDAPKTDGNQNKNKSKPVSKALKNIEASKENQETSQPRNQRPTSTGSGVNGGLLPTISEHRENSGASLITVSKKGQRSAKGTSERQQKSSSSSEELTDEDESFHPNKEKSKRKGLSSSSRRQGGHKQKRKSSSESSEKAGPSKRPRNPSDLDVVLDAFQEFVNQYKQTVNDTVKRSIDAFSRTFDEQLSEIITESRELKNLKRENAKLNSTINQKRTRFLEASNDLIKEKMKLTALQKDHDELQQRCKALKEGTSLLTNLQELNKRYLDHRNAHPDEVETYGPSCMPAMLLETRCIMGTEQQLKTVNDQLQQVIDESED